VKPAPFDYHAPETVEEAVRLLADHGEEARLIAGGQSLVPLMALRLATPRVLVDLNRVRGLEYVRLEGDTLVLGALARHRTVELLPGLRDRCPLVVEAVELIGHVAIRNRGTVAGSLAHADPAAEWPAVGLALDGEVDAVGPSGVRTMTVDDLLVTHFTTALAPDEVLTEVRLRLPVGRVGSAFLEVARRHGDFALAGVGAVLWMDDGTVRDARVALIGVRDRAVRARSTEAVLRGAAATWERLADAAAAVEDDIDPVSDLHASAEFRRHLARVLTLRALERARSRAGREGVR
jgi:carbon-monoxide dehydrogenase medium subunit